MKITQITLLKSIVLVLFGFGFGNKSFAQKDIKIAFGSNSAIVVNGKNHSLSFIRSGKEVISGALAAFSANGKNYTVAEYPAAVFTSEKVTDNLSSGIRYYFVYKSQGKPTVTQQITAYKNREYAVTQLIVEAEGGKITTNYIAPLTNGVVKFEKAANLHTVFMPYDNDAFVSYESKRADTITQNNSAEVGLVFNNVKRNGFIIGSLEHTVWKSAVQTKNDNSVLTLNTWAGYTEKAVTRDSIAHGVVSGKAVASPKYFIGYFDDWRTGLEEYAKANRLTEPPYIFNWDKPTPVGWNSWGVLMDKITPENTSAVVDFFADEIPQFRVGNTAYIDLDSFWDNFDRGSKDYVKLKAFADYCYKKGLQPGVYWAPFTDWGWKDGPGRKVDDTEYTFGDIWTKTGKGYFDFDGARAIDPTHPATLKRVDDMIARLKACGFKMIKIDFLGHAAAESTAFYNKNVTTGMQAYKVGMEHLIKALDGQMLVYAAISPNLATARYAHMRRIACDAWKTIEHTQYTLNSVNYGWWQTYAYNFVDADHVVFADESDGENRARLISAVITGTLITGDDYSKTGNWSNRAKQWLQNPGVLKIVAEGKAFRPVEGDTGKKTSEAFVRKSGDKNYLAVFNYGKSAKGYKLSLERLGIANGTYKITDVLSGETFTVKGAVEVNLGAEDGHLYKIEKQ